MLPICVRTERVWPKLSSIQGIRANLVYIVSLRFTDLQKPHNPCNSNEGAELRAKKGERGVQSNFHDGSWGSCANYHHSFLAFLTSIKRSKGKTLHPPSLSNPARNPLILHTMPTRCYAQRTFFNCVDHIQPIIDYLPPVEIGKIIPLKQKKFYKVAWI